ncbi:hypothetical protein [Sulfitobacter pontiacus]|jgi:hypothetical protein|uniref:hypothetical protein n=1 Tax=Sulfitobacter pontiacus TaxID=60137 RepID=UPI000E8C4AA8|nr:hypothetical protein [Sulfitobacter pontiacus]HBU55375.1 hypothetical protein [Sulfitobacter sp.]HCI98510.1 hypothetical protein [Sulfitobacter sp.]|tara:strand:- start:3271 stop:3795 length:525 start_codon:yes stop_codon:yes gene_type:complete
MKILALDIATHTGIAVGSAGRDPQCWSVDLGEGLTEDYRFSEILKLTHGLIVTHEPDLIICEAFIGGKNASAYLIGLVACVRGCAFNRAVSCELVFPATVRKHFLGKAYTSRDFPGMKQAKAKIEIKKLVKQRAELMGWEIPDLDAADAAATWDWACATHVPNFQAKPVGGLFK